MSEKRTKKSPEEFLDKALEKNEIDKLFFDNDAYKDIIYAMVKYGRQFMLDFENLKYDVRLNYVKLMDKYEEMKIPGILNYVIVGKNEDNTIFKFQNLRDFMRTIINEDLEDTGSTITSKEHIMKMIELNADKFFIRTYDTGYVPVKVIDNDLVCVYDKTNEDMIQNLPLLSKAKLNSYNNN